MKRLVTSLFAVTLVLAGCGKEEAKKQDGPGGQNAPVVGGGKPPGGPAKPSGGGGAPVASSSLYPLKVGNEWTYDVESFGVPVCDPGVQTSKVVEKTQRAGREAFKLKSFCRASGDVYLLEEAGKIKTLYGAAYLVALDLPPKDGQQWTMVTNIRFVWKSAGDVRTPAGSFSGCWKKEQIVPYEAWEVYCPGVGMVESYSKANGSGWRAVLKSTNVK